MSKIAFISCVSKKLTGKHRAKDLYVSELFEKSLAYTLQNFDHVFILSAKYGLLELDDVIESYELTLNNFSKLQLENWSKRVMIQLKDKIRLTDKLYFFCGKNYKMFLYKWLPNNKEAPLEHLRIGKQLSFYLNNLK